MDKILCPIKNHLQLTASAPNMLFESFSVMNTDCSQNV